MTIASTNNKSGPYVCDGVTVAFPVTFGFISSADLVVTETDTATGADTVKTLSTNYTVTGGGTPPATGTVTAVTAPPAGKTWTLSRSPSAVQAVPFKDLSSFPGVNVETALDLLTMLVQKHDDAISRSLVASVAESGPLALPALATRKGLVLGFDPTTGLPIALAAAPAGVISAAMVATVGAATLALARAAMGAASNGVDSVFTAAQSLKSSTASAAAETFLTLLRDKGAAGAAADFLEALAFDGKSSTSVQRSFARIVAQIVTATNAAEVGRLVLRVLSGGAELDALTIGPGLQVGAPTGGDPGTGKVNATDFQINGASISGALGINKTFTSALTAIPAAGSSITLTHGLGGAPLGWNLYLQNVTTDLGYAAGDIIHAEEVVDTGTRGLWGMVDNANTTQLRVISATTGISLPNKSGSAGGGITPANWNFFARAWR